ncbi:tRNA (34-2'-O)-methyltransferase regulator WDR6 [Palaemon carinicauda]|uniref:tRNA (34-2'-O)-methyltransferase regulator WDR6 n=1 Tax=Palaemon carinicauda TaxID=392227 RepID=UPI0035B624A1
MVEVKELLLSTQITAVKVKENTVFIGEGQYLYIHNLDTGEKLAGTRVFQAAAIHGLQIITSLNGSSAIWKALVWGQKSLSIVLFKPAENICMIHTKEKHFEDWIVDAVWEDLCHIIVATAHNTILYVRLIEEPAEYTHPESETVKPEDNCFGKFEIERKEQCSENCILYCGCIVVGSGFHGSAVLLAGTVFSQVLIWGPWGEKNQHGKIIPFHCLSGHQGVLFSINFCPEQDVITTTSDDRTLMIWKIHKQDESNSEVLRYWNCCQITEEHKCYGHGSRVWRSLVLPLCYISVGEDSKVCVWDHNGAMKMSWLGHDGACIWSVDASEDGTKIVTGGGDGSVKSWCLRLGEPQIPEVMIRLPWIRSDYEIKAGTYKTISQNRRDCKKIKNEPETSDLKFDVDVNTDSIIQDSFSEIYNQTGASVNKIKTNSVVAEDFPRCVAILGIDTYLVMLDSGKLYSWNCKSSEWFLVYEDKRLKKYGVMESCPDQHLVALGTLCGSVVILTADVSDHLKIVADEKIVDGKVFALQWLNSEQFLTCGKQGIIMIWSLNVCKGTIERLKTYTLPSCKQRWVSAACYFTIKDNNHLVCGDRAGSIHLYSENSSEPQHSLRSIHGKNGVTSLRNYQGCLYSTGRDGCIRSLTVQETMLQVIMVTRVSNANWIASLITLCGRLLAVCFHDVKLKVWSLEEDRAVIDIECGGGHRSWALQCSEENNKLSFIYIKDTKPYTFTTTFEDKLMPLIKNPVNTRETMCLEVLFQEEDFTYFATGGEDTTIRLHAISSNENEQLKTFNVIRSHISNVRAMCCIEYMDKNLSGCDRGSSKWIVSAGGRAQLKIWKIFFLQSGNDRKEKFPLDLCCREVTSHMLRTGSNKTWKSQEMTYDPETRYMEATAFWFSKEKSLIILASSDGFIRFFEFDNQLERLMFLGSEAWDHCLLKLETLLLLNCCILVSAATDGLLVFWNVQLILDHLANNSDDYGDSQPVPRVSKIASIKAHQSGINSIAITSKSGGFHPDHFIIASGGDDNKIALWKITGHLSNDKIFSISTSHVCDVYGHASQVTGLSWLTPYHLISTSIDQRVTIWKIHKVDDRDNTQFSSYRNQDEIKSKSNHNPFTDHSGNEKLEVLSTNFTGVPDVKGLTVSNITKHITQTKENPRESSLSKRVFLYGVGLQVYDIEINE